MFNTAMAQAQGEMVAVKRDLSNPHTRSRYASYEALDNAARPIYSRHGFALSFGTEAIPPLMKINGDTASQVDQGGLLVYLRRNARRVYRSLLHPHADHHQRPARAGRNDAHPCNRKSPQPTGGVTFC